MMNPKPPRRSPLGPQRPQGAPRFPQRSGFWERLQRHYDDNPQWGGSIDSRDYLPSTVLPRKSLVRINHLPMGVSIAIHLSATSGNTPIGGPGPGAVPWFEVYFGDDKGSRYGYTAFTGQEIVGGTGVEVFSVSFNTGGVDHLLRAHAWIACAPTVMNVVTVL